MHYYSLAQQPPCLLRGGMANTTFPKHTHSKLPNSSLCMEMSFFLNFYKLKFTDTQKEFTDFTLISVTEFQCLLFFFIRKINTCKNLNITRLYKRKVKAFHPCSIETHLSYSMYQVAVQIPLHIHTFVCTQKKKLYIKLNNSITLMRSLLSLLNSVSKISFQIRKK